MTPLPMILKIGGPSNLGLVQIVQADDAARSEFERAPRRGTNHALPTAAPPEPIEAKPWFSLDTRALDEPPVREYSSGQHKGVFKFPIQIHDAVGSPRHWI